MMAGSFVGGMPGLAAGGFAAAFAFAFLLIGLAVVHAVTRGSPWRSFVLAVLYTAVFVFFAGTSLALTLLGLAEGAFGFRFRQGPHSPNQSN
jgi:biotin transporter BioY